MADQPHAIEFGNIDKDIQHINKTQSVADSEGDNVSIPTEMGDEEHLNDHPNRALEVEQKGEKTTFDKVKARFSRQKKKNLTRVMGTQRYNPFQFGGSLVSSFGSYGTSRKDLTKKLAAADPLKLYLANGWFKMLKKGDDEEANGLSKINREKSPLQNFIKLGKNTKVERVDGRATLTPGQIKTINSIARRSHVGELSPAEIELIEEKMNREEPGKKVGCFSFIKGSWRAVMENRKKEEPESGATDLDQAMPSPTNLEGRKVSKPRAKEITRRQKKSKNKSKASTVALQECLFCHRGVSKEDRLSKKLGNVSDEPIHKACMQCELCRDQVTKVVALKNREQGLPCYCDPCVGFVNEAREMQKEFLLETVEAGPDEYRALVPEGTKLFLEAQIVGMDGGAARGMIPMCSLCGLHLRSMDKHLSREGAEMFHIDCPRADKLTLRFKADMKTTVAGLEGGIVLDLLASSPLLHTPHSIELIFKRDEQSVQYELRQNIRGAFTMIYNLSSKSSDTTLKLSGLDVEKLEFSGVLKEDFGPFQAGHCLLKQEKRMTKNKIGLNGRFEHGLLYDWWLVCIYNESQDLVTPVSLEVTLRIPRVG